MSRLSRYQESISKFIKKNCLSYIIQNSNDEILCNKIENILQKCDNLISIILSTVLNSQCKKQKVSLHGYYCATAIEMLMIITNIKDNPTYFENEYGYIYITKINKLFLSFLNICLSQNIEYIQTSTNKDKINKIFHQTIKILNQKTFNIIDDDIMEYENEPIKKTDLLNLNYNNIKNPKKIISEIIPIKKDSLHKYIKRKYGNICQLSLIIGWLLGYGDEKYISNLEKIGIYLGFIVKISYDFKNIERDLLFMNSQKNTTNFIINFGIQEAFETFFQNKIKFIEGCMNLDIYTNTIKEIIDFFEDDIDIIIDKMPADMKSQLTLSK